MGCGSDSECSNSQVCHNRQCIDACRLNNPCSISAVCVSRNHRANCECPPGLEGDPFVRCVSVECRTNNECPLNRVCLSKKCVDPCLYSNRCASNAICLAANHAAICQCPENLPRGDPLSYCEPLKIYVPPPQCTQDFECPKDLACINEKCLNPCKEIGPCDSSAECRVINSVPVRTMMCVCPDNWAPNENGQCRPVQSPLPPPGCKVDNECPQTEACFSGVCRDPCNCGSSAQCSVQNHRAICKCNDGHEGNPNIACYPGNFITFDSNL